MGLADSIYLFKVLLRYKGQRQRVWSLWGLYCELILSRLIPSFAQSKLRNVLGMKVEYTDRRALDGLIADIFIKRVYDIQLAAAKPFIVDCGSNIGLSILFFKQAYKTAEIIGFEPDRCTFEKLRANVSFNRLQNIRLYNAAVSDTDGRAILYSDYNNRTAVGMSLTNRLEGKGLVPIGSEVESVALSRFVDRTVDLLKLDVEGVELKIIRELHDRDKLKFIQNVVIEFHRDLNNNRTNLGRYWQY